MKALSEFLTEYLLSNEVGVVPLVPSKWNQESLHKYLLKSIKDAITKYKKHLQEDVPKTVGWAMIEKQLVIALEHMEDPAKSKNARNQDGTEFKSGESGVGDGKS